MKTAFGFRLRLRRYDQVKTGSSESQVEAEELNLTNYLSVGTCIVIGLSFPFRFSLDRNDGVISGVGRTWKRSDSSDSDSVALMTPPTTPILNFH